ncbi:MAG: metallophosphoesterase family protein [Candidatus Rokuibacteriota bacterium]
MSDVHANLEALTAVLADAAAEGAHSVLCLGDLVGYGADPAACVETVGGQASAVVAGNHEHGALGLLDLRWFNPWARTAARWTGEQLDDGHRDYLAGLPLIRTVEDATLVHASPRSPEEWDYLVSADDGLQVFGDFATRLCFIGHSHLPGVWSVGSGGPDHAGRLDAPEAQVHLDDGRRYLVNVGSVGQPRDRDPRACYAVWDLGARSVRIRRVPYDHVTAAAKILAAGLPSALAERLAHGG